MVLSEDEQLALAATGHSNMDIAREVRVPATRGLARSTYCTGGFHGCRF